jgi:hypothetical protein
MKKERWIFLLLIFSLGCTLTQGSLSTLPVSTPTMAQTAQPSATRPLPEITLRAVVCTGVEDGHLRVRSCAGASCLQTGLLNEGAVVEIVKQVQAPDGGMWALIHSAVDGWVNRRYLCIVD